MSAFISSLSAIWDFLMQVLTVIFNLYVQEPLFCSILTLWVLDRVFGIFKLIRG